MWKYISILIVYILISPWLCAQNPLSVSQVDRQTAELFRTQKWKQLVLAGENSIKQGIDFYYLRLRMGIAYYKLQNYRKSAVLFQNLSLNNPEDKSLKEYLYFSYLLGGRYMDARCMQNDLPQSIQQKYGIDSTMLISGIYAETKYEFFPDYAVNTEELQQQIVRKQFHHYSLGLNHQVGKRVALSHAYSRVNVENSTISDGLLFSEKVRQDQYYLKNSIQCGWGTVLVLGGHWIHTKIKGHLFNESTIDEVAMLTSHLKGNGNGGNGNGNGNGDTISNNISYGISQNSFIGYLGLRKDIASWNTHLGILYSNIDDLIRWQQEVSIRFYPLGNLKLYLLGSFTNQMEEVVEGDWLNRRYWKCSTGYQLTKSTWLLVGYSWGDMFKQIENEGYSVYNGVNLVKNRKEISCYQYFLNGKLSIFLLFQNQKERNNYWISSEMKWKHINVQSITGGVKWNF